MTIFNDLSKRASEFVEKQKGAWDHSKWQDFLSDVQKKGVKMTEDVNNSIGLVLESIKKFYESSTDTGKKGIGNVSDQATKFIDITKGKWEHVEWEKFVKDIQQKGIDLTEEARSSLGGILESLKKLYNSLPLIPKAEKEEQEATEKPEKVEATKTPEVEVSEKQVKPTVEKKVETKVPEKAEKPLMKKEEKPPMKKEVKAKDVKKPEVTSTVKESPPKKEKAAEPTVKKPADTKTTKITKPKKTSTSKK